MAEDLTYGMVGGSLHAFIGDVHRKALALDPRVQLVAGCFSTTPEHNERTADACHVSPERTYADYLQMATAEAERPDGIDFVVITTPNHLHYPIAKAFLEVGIPVVCEKPLSVEIAEAQELADLARDKGHLFAVTHAYTGYTMLRVMRDMIAEGKIGSIIAVHAAYTQDWLLGQLANMEDTGPVWRLDPEYSGIANCAADIGTHVESAIRYVTGLKIRKLLATVNRYGHALDLNDNILVEYENGVNGGYWISQIASGRKNSLALTVCGDEGAIEWEQEFPDYLRYTPKGQPTQTLSRGNDYITEKSASYSRFPAGHPEGLYVAFANLYRDYVTALLDIKNGKQTSPPDFPTAEDGLEGVKFVHAVIESARNDSKWVQVN